MDAATLSQYLNYPIQAPPPGVTPNFVNPPSIAYVVYITAGVCIVLMTGFPLARLLSKVYGGGQWKSFKTDEVFFVIGLLFCLFHIALIIICVSGSAFGRHQWDILLGDFTKSQLVLSLLNEIFLPVSLCFVKVSVLILYYQLFRILKWMRVGCIVGIVAITAFQVSLAVSYAAMCAPSTGTSQLDFLAAFISDACDRSRVVVLIQGAVSVLIDIFLLILPVPAVWNLQMPLKRKIAVLSMFMVGFCACAASIVSLIYRVGYYTIGDDNTYLACKLYATAMAEEAAGVMICCMPSCSALVKSVKGPVRAWLTRTYASGRALRLTTRSDRSNLLQSGGQSDFKGSQSNFNASPEPNQEAGSYPYSMPSNPPEAWIGAYPDYYALQQLEVNPNANSIWKQTEIQVSRDTWAYNQVGIGHTCPTGSTGERNWM